MAFVKDLQLRSVLLTWIELLDNKFSLSDHLCISFLDKAAQNFFHSLDIVENIASLAFHVITARVFC